MLTEAMNANTVIGLVIVGLVGFFILYHNNSDDAQSFSDIVQLETIGYILLGIALTLGVIYTIAPIPVIQIQGPNKNKPKNILSPPSLFGDIPLTCVGGKYKSNSILSNVTGGDLDF